MARFAKNIKNIRTVQSTRFRVESDGVFLFCLFVCDSVQSARSHTARMAARDEFLGSDDDQTTDASQFGFSVESAVEGEKHATHFGSDKPRTVMFHVRHNDARYEICADENASLYQVLEQISSLTKQARPMQISMSCFASDFMLACNAVLIRVPFEQAFIRAMLLRLRTWPQKIKFDNDFGISLPPT
jgi:hypothetical protein